MFSKQIAGISHPEAEKGAHEIDSFSELMKIGDERKSFLLAKGNHGSTVT